MKKKKLFIAACAAVLAVTPLAAQGYPVLDVANLMQTINTLYATYDEITQAIHSDGAEHVPAAAKTDRHGKKHGLVEYRRDV